MPEPGGRSWCRGVLLTCLLSIACLACFLIEPRTTSSDTATQNGLGPPPPQSIINEENVLQTCLQLDLGGIFFSAKVPSFRWLQFISSWHKSGQYKSHDTIFYDTLLNVMMSGSLDPIFNYPVSVSSAVFFWLIQICFPFPRFGPFCLPCSDQRGVSKYDVSGNWKRAVSSCSSATAVRRNALLVLLK